MYDKASIALIPSGFKSGVVDNLYSVLPSNGNGDFNHSRSSHATRVNKDGLIESVGYAPRLDYTGNVDCPHLLLEPNRTNIFQRSEEFDNVYWSKTSATITPNSTISPDGSLSADLFNINNPSGEDIVARTLSFSSGVKTNISIFVKDNDFNNQLILGISSNLITITYDFLTETILSSTGSWLNSVSITKGFNGFNRIDFTVNPTFNSFAIFQIKTNNQGNGSFYIWGAQLEEGSYPTSYIPTSGSAETRTADICNNAGTSAEFNDSEGVLFAEISTNADSNFKRISIHSGSYVNSVFLDFDNTNNLYGKVIVGGSAVVTIIASGLNIENNNKIALSYKENDFKLFVNGSKVGTDVTGATPTGLNNLAFDLGGGQDFYGKCKQLIYFNEALSDSELQTLTS